MLPKVYEDQKYTDITFQLFDGKVYAHKCILASSNIEYFNRLFNTESKWSENNDNIIKIDDIKKDSFEVLIKYIYGYEFDTDSFNIFIIKNLLELGDRFVCQDMIEKVLNVINNSKNKTHIIDNYEEVLKIFMKLSPTYDDIIRGFNKNHYKIIEDITPKLNLDLECQVYNFKLSSNDMKKVDFIREILKQDHIEDKDGYITDLLKTINPHKITQDYRFDLVKYKYYDATEVLKLSTFGSNAEIVNNYPLFVCNRIMIGDFKNGIFTCNSRNIASVSLDIDNVNCFRFSNVSEGIELLYDNNYAIYEKGKLMNFDISIYDKVYTNPGNKKFKLEKDIDYIVYALLYW